MRILTVALAAFVLVGCKVNLATDIYSSDLRDAASGTTGLTAPASMAFQVPDTDDCAEHAVKITALMTDIMELTPKGCESAEMESYLFADIQIPILVSEAAWTESEALLGLTVVEREGDIGVLFAMNRVKFAHVSPCEFHGWCRSPREQVRTAPINLVAPEANPATR